MRSTKLLFTMLSLTFLAFSCQKENVAVFNGSTNEDFKITIQEQYVSPPSRVSVFFKVATKDGKPVANLTEDNFKIYEQGRNDDEERLLSQDETTRRLSDNSQVFEYRTMLVLDLSGSVLNSSLEDLKSASTAFIQNLFAADSKTKNMVGIWWFDGRDALHPLIGFTQDDVALVDAINSITPEISNDSSTDLFGAVIKSATIAENQMQVSANSDILSAFSIIMFTDGTDQAARYAKEDAYEVVNEASEGINFYSIGLGSEIDEPVLRKIGKTSFAFADDTAALTEKFEEIANLIADEANAYYLFEYCTPKRDGSGVNDLHIVVHKDDKEGRKITSFDATGFTNDCDLD